MIRLALFLDGRLLASLEPPLFGARDWILGVAAVQVEADGERWAARLRVHVTGADAPQIWPLGDRALVQAALVDGELPILPPVLRPRRNVPVGSRGIPASRVARRSRTLQVCHAPRALPSGRPGLPGWVHYASVGALVPAPQVPSIQLFLDDELLAETVLTPVTPSARAFGHVYCRWLRHGEIEPGFDLTEFAPPSPGEKYQRVLSRSLPVGSVVSYAITVHPAVRSTAGW